MTTNNTNPKEANPPKYHAYIVIDPKAGSNRKAYWHEIGAVWPHKNGTGFDLIIPAGISVTGRIVCTERTQPSAEPTDEASA